MALAAPWSLAQAAPGRFSARFGGGGWCAQRRQKSRKRSAHPPGAELVSGKRAFPGQSAVGHHVPREVELPKHHGHQPRPTIRRFAKHSLGWTTVRPCSSEAADRWTWLVAVVFWQLYLARDVVTDCRLPWERPLPAHQLSPGRVRRAFSGLLSTLGTPATAPKPRGKSPGRCFGQRPGRRKRHPVTYRASNRAA